MGRSGAAPLRGGAMTETTDPTCNQQHVGHSEKN